MGFLMGKNLSWKPLKASATFLSLVIWAWSLTFTPAFAQEYTLQKEIQTKPILSASLDLSGNIYVADVEGNITKYDTTGNQLATYSPDKRKVVNHIEADRPLRIFAFNKGLQEFLFLDKFLRVIQEIPIANIRQIGFARLATLSADNNIWVYDENDQALKKINIENSQILLQTPLQSIASSLDLTFMKEHQNMLYISDQTIGVLVFDQFGNYQQTIPIKGLDFFSFEEDGLFYLKKGQVTRVALNSLNQANIILENNRGIDFMIFKKGKLIMSSHSMKIYMSDK